MRAFTQSMLSFPWAMSLFGIEQLGNLLTPNLRVPQDRWTLPFDAVTQATVEQFGVQNVIQGVFQVGDELQRDVVDRLCDFFTPAALNLNSMVQMPADMLRWSTETCRYFIPAGDSLLAWQEFQNKLAVFLLVPGISAQLQLPEQPPYPPLQEAVERAYALDPYSALWAVEGLGHWYGDTFWERHEMPHRLLTDARVNDLTDESLLMLHAGIGLSFAQHYLKTVNHLSPIVDIRQALQEIIRLCQENSRPGYEGAALESLGLTTRSATFTGDARPDVMVQIVGQQLAEIAPDVLGYFWHGVGRGIYFLPINILPFYGSIWHAYEMVRREAADECAWRNALAGLAWGVTMVNIRQPAIVANLLQQHGEELSENAAFSYGVASSLMMRYDTTPDASFIMPFYQYQPDATDPRLVWLWNRLVRQPAQEALQTYYPILKQRSRLGELFRYHSLPELIQ